MARLRVLVGCEFSGVVRDAFIARGHDAVSCDLLPTEAPGPHLQCNVLEVLEAGWDAAIFFPPCTDLASSGARWFKYKSATQPTAIDFFLTLASSNIPMVAVENPVGIMSRIYRRPDQIIQPWQFGHGETKATCLWLNGLLPLEPTQIVAGRFNRVHREPPSPDRWRRRSRTYKGVADAMADQWGREQEAVQPHTIICTSACK